MKKFRRLFQKFLAILIISCFILNDVQAFADGSDDPKPITEVDDPEDPNPETPIDPSHIPGSVILIDDEDNEPQIPSDPIELGYFDFNEIFREAK